MKEHEQYTKDQVEALKERIKELEAQLAQYEALYAGNLVIV